VAVDDEIVKFSAAATERFYTAYRASGRTYESLAGEIGVSRQHLRNVIARKPCKNSLRSGAVLRLGRALGIDATALWRDGEVRGLRILPSPAFYEVLGYIVADGCFTSDRLCIADKDHQNAEFYVAKFETAFGRTARVVKGPHQNFEVTCHSLPLGRFLRRLLGPGIVRSRERQVPAFVFSLAAEARAAFLRGYFDGEGWVGDHQVAATSGSLYLLVGVQWLLASLGIDSQIS
jgi:intein/homing endonuclease